MFRKEESCITNTLDKGWGQLAKEHEYNQDKPLNVAVLTVSDTREAATDRGGDKVRHMLEEAGHFITTSAITKDDREDIQVTMKEWLALEAIDAIITTGGSGLGFRDITVEAIEPYFTKKIVGFGELFRMISYTEDVGSKALLSRAEAGISKEKVIYILPGSVKAVYLAMKKLVLPELHHIVHEITKHKKS